MFVAPDNIPVSAEVSTVYNDLSMKLDTVKAYFWIRSGEKQWYVKTPGGEYWSSTEPKRINAANAENYTPKLKD